MLSIISKQTREKTNRQGKRHTRKNKQTTTKKNKKTKKTTTRPMHSPNGTNFWWQKIVSNSEYGWYIYIYIYFFFFWAASEFAPERKLKQKI